MLKHDSEASAGEATANNVTAIAATRIGSLHFKSLEPKHAPALSSRRDWTGSAGKFATEFEMHCGAPQVKTPQWNQLGLRHPTEPVIGARMPPPRFEPRRRVARSVASTSNGPPTITSRLLRGCRFGWLAENPAAAFAQTGALSVHAGRDPFHVGNFR